MPQDFLDRYSRLDSPVHRLPASFKLGAAFLTVLITLALPRAATDYFAGLAIVLAGTALLSRVPLVFLLRRLFWLEPVIVGIALMAWLQPQGGQVFAGILVKSSLCLGTMLLLSSITPFSEVLRLLQRLRVPPLLVTTLALLYRYIFVLQDELERMRRARASRTFSTSQRRTWSLLATLLGQLFIRSTERAERIYAAMCARGWK